MASAPALDPDPSKWNDGSGSKQNGMSSQPSHVEHWPHRRWIKTEEKAKVVVSVWGEEFIQFKNSKRFLWIEWIHPFLSNHPVVQFNLLFKIFILLYDWPHNCSNTKPFWRKKYILEDQMVFIGTTNQRDLLYLPDPILYCTVRVSIIIVPSLCVCLALSRLWTWGTRRCWRWAPPSTAARSSPGS